MPRGRRPSSPKPLEKTAVARPTHLGSGSASPYSSARNGWGACDVLSKDGMRVEVKSTCEVQTWNQAAPSKAIFTIRPSRGWNADDGCYVPAAERNSDVFVFCQLVVGDQVPDPLELAQWRFFVLPTAGLNERAPKARTVGLAAIRRWGAVEVGWEGLGEAVRKAWAPPPRP